MRRGWWVGLTAVVMGCASGGDVISMKRGDFALLYCDTKSEVSVAVDRLKPKCAAPATAEEATRCAEFTQTVTALRQREQVVRDLIRSEQTGLSQDELADFARLALRLAVLAGI